MTKYDQVPAKWRKMVELAPGRVSVVAARAVSDRLLYEARLAHLDGRDAQARKFSNYAHALLRTARA